MLDQENYDMLELKYKNSLKDLETANQALYDLKRQVQTSGILEEEYQEEIRQLQTELDGKNGKLQTKIQQLEEALLSVSKEHKERIDSLEKQLFDKSEDVEDLQRKLKELDEKKGDVSIAGHDESLLVELSGLKEVKQVLEERLEELEELCVTQKAQMEERIMALIEENTNLTESLACKREEFLESQTITQNLQDEVSALTREVEELRSKPLDDQSRGNSLFAEVNDRRLQLEQKYNQMKNKYLEMRQERALQLKKISNLQGEIAMINRRWEKEAEEKKDDEDMLMVSYKNQVKTMEKVIESYKKEVSEKPQRFDNSNEGVKFFETMLNAKKQEVEKLRTSLAQQCFNHTLLSQDLAEAKRENRRLRCEMDNLRNEMGRLSVRMEEMELARSVEEAAIPEVVEGPEPKRVEVRSIMKQSGAFNETIAFDKSTTNNNTQKVQFDSDTTKATPAKPVARRGCKVLTAKPVHFSSLCKKE